MQKNIGPVIIIIAVLVLLVGGWLYWNHLNTPQATSSSQSGTSTQQPQTQPPAGMPGGVKPSFSPVPNSALPSGRK
jgi:hypothetical protein